MKFPKLKQRAKIIGVVAAVSSIVPFLTGYTSLPAIQKSIVTFLTTEKIDPSVVVKAPDKSAGTQTVKMHIEGPYTEEEMDEIFDAYNLSENTKDTLLRKVWVRFDFLHDIPNQIKLTVFNPKTKKFELKGMKWSSEDKLLLSPGAYQIDIQAEGYQTFRRVIYAKKNRYGEYKVEGELQRL